jgi:two-component system, NtrC family, response regulator HydG
VKRISLTEASRKAPKILARGDSLLLEEGAPPTLSDLAGALQFALGDGRIWLNDERMVLMQTNVLGHLRKQMIEAVGVDAARALFRKTGWLQGIYYANLVTKRFRQDDLTAALAAGPRLHTMEGFAKVSTKRFEFDLSKGHYHGEFTWHDSTEAAEHIRHLGHSDCPVCWMQVGVPSGYTSTLFGRPVIFREMECVGQGAERCLVVGRDAAAWGDDVPELADFGIDAAKAKSKPWVPPVTLPDPPRTPPAQNEILGRSAAIARARRQIQRVAPYEEPVMFLGEAGTGKERFARHLHELGPTSQGPFVPVNCSIYAADMPPHSHEMTFLAEGGLFEKAAGGTLFLNDVLALPAAQQAGLAMAIKEEKARKYRLRIMSATHGLARDAVAGGALRADLFYQLSLLPIVIPPLRERRDDLPALIEHLLARHAKHHGKPVRGIAGSAMDLLLRYDYPGNVRELSNMIERGVIYAEPGGDLNLSHLSSGLEKLPDFVDRLHRRGTIVRRQADGIGATERSLQEIEIDAYLVALTEAGWNISEAARKLGLTRAKLAYRITKLGLSAEGH